MQAWGRGLARLGVCLAMVALLGSDRAAGNSDAEKRTEKKRQAMVQNQIVARGVDDARVLAAMRQVPRHEFVPADVRASAYDDRPLPIGWEQTISQPYIVALMTSALRLQGSERVLEIGTGSGYQAAVLAAIVPEVYSIEILPELAQAARATLDRLGLERVRLRTGDGFRGWPEHAPFDAIVVTASPLQVPQPLLEQLAPGGRMVLPVGGEQQLLLRITRGPNGYESDTLAAVRFVPMTGEAAEKP